MTSDITAVTSDLSMRPSVTTAILATAAAVLGLASVAAAAFGEGNKFPMHYPNLRAIDYAVIILILSSLTLSSLTH